MNFVENTIKEQYEIISVLKKKEASEVLIIRHKALKKEVILRKFKGQADAYRMLQKINTDNIPTVFSVSTENDVNYVIEEFIDGITVADVLEGGLYNESGARVVVKSVCNALSVLHSLNIIHRDVKPENIMVTNSGKVFLIDFDAARIFKAFKTDDTCIMGTTGYAAPEQFGINQTDERADIFAIGVLLNVMLTGEHPSKKMYQGKLAKIIEKCTKVSPNERFQSVQEIIKKL